MDMIAPRRIRGSRSRISSPTTLARAAIEALPRTVLKPAYRPNELSAGIVHFGVGNFHRSHQAVYLDALFNLGLDRDWAIVGAGIRPADEEMRRKLAAQEHLTTVVEQEADNLQARVIGSMIDFLPVGDANAIIRTLADPAIRIVSLTVTEGGYYIDPASLRFDPDHPEIIADAENPQAPKTVFGLILAGLKRRRSNGVLPFTVLSCDNIPGNGHVTRNAVVGLAQLVDPTLADWIEANVAFPNSMVDRITPATTDRERAALQRDFGIVDRCPVFSEAFTQWVIEDHFSAGRPALETVGVQFVDDVRPFELLKIRILNGGHATIAYAAGLLDIEFVHEAIADPLIRAFLAKVEREEIIPTLRQVPGIDLGDYYALIERRFSNPKVGDTIKRLCYDGANRQPKFILPTAADRVARGQSVRGLALVSALWAQYCYGETDSGAPISPNDPIWDRLSSQAKLARREPQAWLSMTDIFGELAANPMYVANFTEGLSSLRSSGVRSTLERYLAV
jgi:mannitol 2-dehydrogenase